MAQRLIAVVVATVQVVGVGWGVAQLAKHRHRLRPVINFMQQELPMAMSGLVAVGVKTLSPRTICVVTARCQSLVLKNGPCSVIGAKWRLEGPRA